MGERREAQGPESYVFSESRRRSGPESYVFYEVCSLWGAPGARNLCILRVQKALAARILRILRELQPLGRHQVVGKPLAAAEGLGLFLLGMYPQSRMAPARACLLRPSSVP